MKHLKRFVLTMLVALVSCATAFAHDFEAKNSDGVTIYYKIMSKGDLTCAVSYRGDDYDSYTNEYSGNVIIPSTVTFDGKTYSVTSIGDDAFYKCSSLQSVTIPNSVTSIGSYAFCACKSLLSVTIPNSVTSIGNYAFCECSSLQSVTIPNSVTSIGKDAFYKCSRLKVVINYSSLGIKKGSTGYGYIGYYANVVIKNPICDGDWYFYDEEKTKLAAYIGSSSSVIIPNSVISIGESAFSHCGNLKSVIIGTGVRSIGKDAFYNCPLYKVTLLPNTVPSGVCYGKITYVANNNYSGSSVKKYDYLSSYFEVDGIRYVPISPSEKTCAAIDCTYDHNIKNIKMGESVNYRGIEMKIVEINPYVLIDNDNVETIDISSPADIQACFAEYCDNVKSIKLDNAGYVGLNAFKDAMTNTTEGEVALNNAGYIGESAFMGCTGLKDLSVGSSVTDIGAYAFNSSMTNVENGKITLMNKGTLGNSCFNGCTKLADVTLNEGITKLGDYCFNECTGLANVFIPSSVESIEYCSFADCTALSEITLNEGLKSIGEQAFRNTNINSISIPSSTNSIGNGTFNGCKSLTKFEAKDGEEKLSLGYYYYDFIYYNGDGLFYDCPLNEVVIGRNLVYETGERYGYSPFYRNATLEKVTFTDIPTEVLTNEFYGCSSLKEVSIGDEVTKIGDYAFSGCTALETFSFGKSMAEIGTEAFSDCTAMTKLYAEPTTPPTCGTQALDDINKWNCTLYVEPSAMDAYKAADQWKEFFFMEAKDYGNSVMATDVKLSIADSTLNIGDSTVLTATVVPDNATNKTVTWTSSDEKVATVNADGTVTAIGIGTATITATAVGGAKAECKVTVTAFNKITYFVDGVEYHSEMLEYGTEIKLIDAPAKEGYTFSGWSEVPATMPDADVTVTGTFTANVHNIIYMVDGVEYHFETLAYGTEIKLIDAPVKEGYTFSGWSEVPATMPDADVMVTGTFIASTHEIIYMVDGMAYHFETLAYGMEIKLIDEPVKEGYTFSGWSEVPATMPDADVTVTGTFIVNTHEIIYMVDGKDYHYETLTYGMEIKLIDEPVKEGYTFSGWSEVPATMPDADVTVTGTFTANTYYVIYMVDGVEYKRVAYKYGEDIVPEEAPEKEGYLFNGWSEIPETMPAHDVTVYTDMVADGIDGVVTGDTVRVYTLNGVLVNAHATSDDLKSLPKGMYIINGKKMVVK